jgi:phosphotriesterase-related protein
LFAKLADAGHGDRLLLGTDRNRVSELRVAGGPGYDHLLRNFVPKLRGAGFDEAMLNQILVTNPARILSFDSP